jgi:hypothetical protein
MHNNQSLSPLRVFIDPVKITGRGQGYSVSFNGETIITNTRNPAADACRHLVALGYRGRMEMWENERPHPRLVFHDIKKAARLTVSETERHGPRIVRYDPMSDEHRQRLRAIDKHHSDPEPDCRTVAA